MKISEIIKQPEGRRLEFKETLPTSADLAKTIVAFANDAGGELYIGIKDSPREITGIAEDELMIFEERISNIIHDHCYPVIIPEITFHGDDKRFIKVHIYRGSNLPYYLKSKGKIEGTYIRVGSSNRLADTDIIAELERQRRNISFDSELVHDKSIDELNIDVFKGFFIEKTGEELNPANLRKLELTKEFQGNILPTNAFILFSDGPIKNELFPYAKIECARFKGITADEFIDQKTIDENIALQAEATYDFVLRHINKGAFVKGVYTLSRWEYPVVAIREVIRNAIVHRDYSLIGKDIKVAIYDDLVEITSPGKLMPSIDFNEMNARQSDIRNKVIAPVFKKLGIIDQWGNGLKLIAEELNDYPEIEFKWIETGLQFQVQFINKAGGTKQIQLQEYDENEIVKEIGTKLGLSWEQVGIKSALSQNQVGTKLALSWHQVLLLLDNLISPSSVKVLMQLMNLKDRTKFREKYINPMVETGIIQMTVPDKPNSSNQQYLLTIKGKKLLEYLKHINS